MTLAVVVTDRACEQIDAAFHWWSENRSGDQAGRWYEVCQTALASLAENPERHPKSPESSEFPYEIRDRYFGLGARPTHRAVFSLRPNMVVVIAVRHLAQESLSPDDL